MWVDALDVFTFFDKNSPESVSVAKIHDGCYTGTHATTVTQFGSQRIFLNIYFICL